MTKFSIRLRFFYHFLRSKFIKQKIKKEKLILNNFQKKIQSYKFKNFWFLNNLQVFNYYLPNQLDKKFKYLEIGTNEGMSLLYVLLKYKKVSATSIDIVNTVKKKIKKFKNLKIITSDSILALRKLTVRKLYFDFIYVDGLHNGEHVIIDAIESFKLLKKGGIIVFDDFMSVDNKLKYQTREGLYYFLLFFKKEINILYFQNILILKKK